MAGAKRITDFLGYNNVVKDICRIFSIIHTQTITALELWSKYIGNDGAQPLAAVLQNTMVYSCLLLGIHHFLFFLPT